MYLDQPSRGCARAMGDSVAGGFELTLTILRLTCGEMSIFANEARYLESKLRPSNLQHKAAVRNALPWRVGFTRVTLNK